MDMENSRGTVAGSRPPLRFEVSFGGRICYFSEVSGLAANLKDKAGFYFPEGPVGRIVSQQRGHLFFKRGFSVHRDDFDLWMNVALPQPFHVRILLKDENGRSVHAWIVYNARIVKINSAGLSATGQEVVFEEIELAHEGVVVD